MLKLISITASDGQYDHQEPKSTQIISFFNCSIRATPVCISLFESVQITIALFPISEHPLSLTEWFSSGMAGQTRFYLMSYQSILFSFLKIFRCKNIVTLHLDFG